MKRRAPVEEGGPACLGPCLLGIASGEIRAVERRYRRALATLAEVRCATGPDEVGEILARFEADLDTPDLHLFVSLLRGEIEARKTCREQGLRERKDTP